MLNLMKSEQYRFVRSRNYYLMGLLYTLLMGGAAVILYVFNQLEPGFQYGNERFFYRNVLAILPGVFAMLFIFPVILVGEHTQVLKNTVAYGYSRQAVYTAKLLVILAGFLMFALVLSGISVLLGTTLLVRSHEHALTDYSRALLSALPVMVAGVTAYYAMTSVLKKSVHVNIAFVVIFFLPHYLLSILQFKYAWAVWLFRHNPVYYLFNLHDTSVYAAWEPWAVGALYTLFFGLAGLFFFKKREF